MSLPCDRCGVNAWTDCKHRPGVPKPAVLVDPPPDPPKRDFSGQGNNFKARRRPK